MFSKEGLMLGISPAAAVAYINLIPSHVFFSTKEKQSHCPPTWKNCKDFKSQVSNAPKLCIYFWSREFLCQSRHARSLIALAIKARTRRWVGQKDMIKMLSYLVYKVLSLCPHCKKGQMITMDILPVNKDPPISFNQYYI